MIVLFSIPESTHGQLQQKTFADYSIADGLTDNNIKGVIQDKYGYIWISTENGLNRFDGLTFTTFPFSKNNISLPGNDISDMQLLDSNNLAIVTTQGLSILDLNTLDNTNIIIPEAGLKYSYKVNYLKKLLVDDNGDFYLTSKSGFYHFNKNRQLVFRHDDYLPPEAEAGMSFGYYTCWVNQNTIITAGEKGIFLYNTNQKTFELASSVKTDYLILKQIAAIQKIEYFKKNTDYYLLQPWKGSLILLSYASNSFIYIDEINKISKASKIPFTPVNSVFNWRSKLFTVNDSTLLLSGKFGGLYHLKINKLTGYLQLDTTTFLKDKKCQSLFIDRDKRYWIGFSDGLKFEKVSKINLQFSKAEIADNAKQSRTNVLQTAVTGKNIYAASTVSGGVHQFDKRTLEYKRTIPFHFPPYGNKSLFAIEKMNNDSLLCGTDAGLFLYSEKTGVSKFIDMPGWDVTKHFISNLFLDSKKNMWISCNFEAGCFVWNCRTKQPVWMAMDSITAKNLKGIFHFAEDKDGNIWLVGTGAARYNTKKHNIDIRLTSFTDKPNTITAAEAVACDDQGNPWFAYSNKGLLLYDVATAHKQMFTTENGLPDNKIIDLKYHQNYIWITCKNGISKINCSTKVITTVCTPKNVHYNNFYSDKLVFDNETNSFFTGAGSSIIKFEAANKEYVNTAPSLVIESITFENDSILRYPQKSIKVSWKNRDFILTFNSINYEDAVYQKYAYRIITDKETKWMLLDDQRKITFNKLDAGTANIEIKVFSPQHLWPDKIIGLSITVVAPYWKNTWFLLLCICCAAALIYGIIKYRYNQLQKVKKIREEISKDLHDEIGATLSGISMYSHLVKDNLAKNEISNATRSVSIIQQSAGEMVNKLNDIVWLLNPDEDSLEKLFIKLDEFAQELCAAKGIHFSAKGLSDFNTLNLPVDVRKNIYLTCKEAINNAVKYSEASSIELTIKEKNQLLEIIVSDNGKGFDFASVKKGNGLRNMQNRIKELNAELGILSKNGEGCSVSFKIKITQ